MGQSEEKRMVSSALRYPFFLIGLAILVLGELVGFELKVSAASELVIAIVGFLFLILSVAIR